MCAWHAAAADSLRWLLLLLLLHWLLRCPHAMSSRACLAVAWLSVPLSHVLDMHAGMGPSVMLRMVCASWTLQCSVTALQRRLLKPCFAHHLLPES